MRMGVLYLKNGSVPRERTVSAFTCSIIALYSLTERMGNNSHGFSPHKTRKKTPKTKKRLAAKRAMLAERASKKKRR